MTVALKKNVPGFRDANGVFRPIRSASYVGGGSSRRRATTKDRRKYSKAKAGDLGKARQERALEDVFDREIRLEREAKAAEKRERDRIERELEREIYGETSGRTSRGKGQTLAQFIRSEGGINTKKKVRKGRVRYGDSLENFTRKGSGSTGLVTTVPGKGKSLDYMHQAAREAGYDVASMDDLLDALDNELRSGKKTYSTHGAMAYNPAKKLISANAADLAKARKLGKASEGLSGEKYWANWNTFRDLTHSKPFSIAAIKKLHDAHDKAKGDEARRTLGYAKRNTAAKKNPDLLSMFANAAVGIASTLQIHEMTKSRKRKAAPKKRGTTQAKRRNPAVKANASQPNLFKRQPKGELYVLTIGSGDDLISVYLHDGDKDGFSKRFKTLAGARSYAKRNKVKLVENPKRNGIIKRAWARSRAASEYRRELRLAAAAERSRARRRKAEAKAKANPPAKRGKTAVARAASGKKAVARSAKANPTQRQNLELAKRKIRNFLRGTHGPIGTWGEIANELEFYGFDFATRMAAIKAVRASRPNAFTKKAPAKAKARKPKAAAKRANPRSTARRRTFEMFQGRKVTTARPMMVSNHAPANLDALGDLVELKIAGGPLLKFNGKGTKLCAANGKLWIAGKRFAKPNPAAKVSELNPIGEIDHVVYGTHKPHHGDHDYTHYIHKLGEESGRRPILCVDREGFPVIRGGNYKIEARGIVD